MIGEAITILDLIIVVVLGLSLIIGLCRGFARPLLSLFGLVAIIVGSILLCESVSNVIEPMFGGGIENAVKDFLLSKDEQYFNIFTTELDWTDETNINVALSALNLPTIISGIIKPTLSSFGTVKLIDVLPQIFTGWALNVIAFVLVAVLLTIVVAFIRTIVGKLLTIGTLKTADRIVGGVVSLVIAYTVVSVVLAVVVSFFMDNGVFSSVYNFVAEQVALSEKSTFPLLHWIVNHNFIGEWVINTLLPSITGITG